MIQTIFRQFTGRKAHPIIQFVKYGIAGGIVAVIGMFIFAVLAWKIFPAFQEQEYVVRLFNLRVEPLDDVLRARNYALCKIIEFFVVNLVCYAINVAWVFERGRHPRWLEILLFYTLSLISFLAGTALGAALILWLRAGAAAAYLANLVAAVLINYAGRKFFVFKG